jgi:hypothetical protein
VCDLRAIADLEGARFVADLHASAPLAGLRGNEPDEAQVATAIREEAEGLKDEVIRLRSEKQLLCPLFLHTRTSTGSVKEKIGQTLVELDARMKQIDHTYNVIAREVESLWPTMAPEIASGTIILDRAVTRFGVRFSKEKGDAARLAPLVPPSAVAQEISVLLWEIAGGTDIAT